MYNNNNNNFMTGVFKRALVIYKMKLNYNKNRIIQAEYT